MNDGVLVSLEWLERVNNLLFGAKQSGASAAPNTSLFYDVRPAVLTSEWTQNSAGLWSATAQFIINDAVDTSFTADIVAPTATANPGGTVGTTRFYLVWRGRWEMVAGAVSNAKITATKTQVIKAATVTKTNINTFQTGAATPSGTVTLTASEYANGGIPYISAIECVDGALEVTTSYLTASFSGNSLGQICYPTGSAASVVSAVATTKIEVVEDIE